MNSIRLLTDEMTAWRKAWLCCVWASCLHSCLSIPRWEASHRVNGDVCCPTSWSHTKTQALGMHCLQPELDFREPRLGKDVICFYKFLKLHLLMGSVCACTHLPWCTRGGQKAACRGRFFPPLKSWRGSASQTLTKRASCRPRR